MTEQPPKPHEACMNCHFFNVNAVRTELPFINPDLYPWFSWYEELVDLVKHREDWTDGDTRLVKLQTRRDDELLYIHAMGCREGVWEEIPPSKSLRINEDFKSILAVAYEKMAQQSDYEERQDTCFFFPHHPGMEYGTAQALWRRRYETQKEIAARELEDRREARERAAEMFQSLRDQDAQDQEGKRHVESRRAGRVLLIVTALAAFATIAQAIAAIAALFKQP